MKIKSIVALKNRLDRVTEGEEIGDDDSRSLTARYDVYEEKVELCSDGGETLYLSVTEAKRLQSVLKELL